jgi:Ceramidase
MSITIKEGQYFCDELDTLSWDCRPRDIGFCESRMGLYEREYMNAFSAFLISFIAASSAINTNRISAAMKAIFTLVFLNGFFSFANHFTLQYGWSQLDEYTMVMAIGFGLQILYDDLLYRQFGKNRTSIGYRLTASVFTAIVYTFISILLVLGSIPPVRTIFSILFVGSIVLLLPGVAVNAWFFFGKKNRRTWGTRTSDQRKLDRTIGKYLIASMVASVGSGLVWLITESLCRAIPDTARAFGFWSHVVWHIGMGWGLVTVGQVILYNRAVNNGVRVKKCTGYESNFAISRILRRAFFTVFLVIEVDLPGKGKSIVVPVDDADEEFEDVSEASV